MNEPMNCRICQNTFQSRDECEPTGICDICAQTELAGALADVKKLNGIITNLDYRIAASERGCEEANRLLREALSEANKWRARILSIRCPDSMRQTEEVCARMNSMLFFSMPQDMRDQLTEEVVVQTLLQLFRRMTPEAALMKVLNERKAKP